MILMLLIRFWGGIWTGQDYVAGTLTAQVDIQYANDTDPSGLGVVVDPFRCIQHFLTFLNFNY